jgi:carboxyl-terminal processing protease
VFKFSSLQDKKKCIVLCIISIFITIILTFTFIFGSNLFIVVNSQNADQSEISKLKNIDSLLRNKYYLGVNPNTYIEGLISGMTNSLNDPYTVYFNKEEMTRYEENISKTEEEYSGVGTTITQDDKGMFEIIEVFDNGAAQKAGIKAGDIFFKVDGEDVTIIKDSTVFTSLLKGEPGKVVSLTMYRKSEDRYFTTKVTLENIKHIYNISSKILDQNIGYINIKMFDADIAKNFDEQVTSLKDKGMKGLIIDLRNNPGGSYDKVVKIADTLLPEGIIVYTEEKNGIKKYEMSDKNEIGIPITVLINGNSASASEVLAGALRDYKKATLIGTKSYGKGIVQSLIKLSDGSGIKITIARYFTPLGECIQGIGINPDVKVEINEKYIKTSISQIPEGEDNQLNMAKDITAEKIRMKVGE